MGSTLKPTTFPLTLLGEPLQSHEDARSPGPSFDDPANSTRSGRCSQPRLVSKTFPQRPAATHPAGTHVAQLAGDRSEAAVTAPVRKFHQGRSLVCPTGRWEGPRGWDDIGRRCPLRTTALPPWDVAGLSSHQTSSRRQCQSTHGRELYSLDQTRRHERAQEEATATRHKFA